VLPGPLPLAGAGSLGRSCTGRGLSGWRNMCSTPRRPIGPVLNGPVLNGSVW